MWQRKVFVSDSLLQQKAQGLVPLEKEGKSVEECIFRLVMPDWLSLRSLTNFVHLVHMEKLKMQMYPLYIVSCLLSNHS